VVTSGFQEVLERHATVILRVVDSNPTRRACSLVANLTRPPANARPQEIGRRVFRVYRLSCNGLRQSVRWRKGLRFERDQPQGRANVDRRGKSKWTGSRQDFGRTGWKGLSVNARTLVSSVTKIHCLISLPGRQGKPPFSGLRTAAVACRRRLPGPPKAYVRSPHEVKSRPVATLIPAIRQAALNS
jgi:hypothetical protein